MKLTLWQWFVLFAAITAMVGSLIVWLFKRCPENHYYSLNTGRCMSNCGVCPEGQVCDGKKCVKAE